LEDMMKINLFRKCSGREMVLSLDRRKGCEKERDIVEGTVKKKKNMTKKEWSPAGGDGGKRGEGQRRLE